MTLTEKIFMGANFNIQLPIDCCRTLTQSHLSAISLALLNFRDHRDILYKSKQSEEKLANLSRQKFP